MSGRKDYEERKEMKKEIYEERARKAEERSKEHSATHNRIASAIPMGQPILTDHYSASRHRNDINKMDNAIRKSIEEDEKADYYRNKLENLDNNKAISSDDPKAIEKLEKKLEMLEQRKVEIKSREHKWYELPYANAEIKRVKERIQQLKELDSIDLEDIIFEGGKVVHNREINRVQIVFDEIPTEEVRTLLKSNGFKWARSEGAWQRLLNKNGISTAKYIVKQIDIGHSNDVV